MTNMPSDHKSLVSRDAVGLTSFKMAGSDKVFP